MNETKHEARQALMRRAMGALCAVGVAGTLLAPAAAFAEVQTNTDGETIITVQADTSNIAFTVPTTIPLSVQADGSLIVASEDEFKITNKSPFDIHVTGITVTSEDGWNIVASASASPNDNSIDLAIGPSGNAADASEAIQAGGVSLSDNAAWNMGYAGSAEDSINLTCSGNVSHVTKDLQTASKVATITWTVAAGQAGGE